MVPILATGLFYLVPINLQQNRLIQFIPQLLAYMALGVWCTHNSRISERLRLRTSEGAIGLKWGLITGLLLGVFNTWIILWIVPNFGGDILFLKETPHAQVPTWIMVPWVIVVIAIGVELNFRGFLIGRLEYIFFKWLSKASGGNQSIGLYLAVMSSALVFAFDPFMVATFQHLHWIAVWDGLIWGWLFAQKKNLYLVIVAHAVEVVILYCSIKAALV